jgi:hypothetical protein
VDGRYHDKQKTDRQLGMAVLSAMPCLCHAHVLYCPKACEISRRVCICTLHSNMTYVPYLHPAAVGPFRFAGYCIAYHCAASMVSNVRNCREKTPCSRLLVSCSSGCVCVQMYERAV